MKQTAPNPSDMNLLMKEISRQSSIHESIEEGLQVQYANYLQLTVHEIWESVLGFSSFGLTDDLFDIGGDSVAAIQIFSEINKEFGIRLAMEELFTADTFSVTWLSELVERYLIELMGKEDFEAFMLEAGNINETSGR